MRKLTVATALALSIAAASGAGAQSSSGGPKNSLTANPFFLLAGWMSAEYERKINSSVSLGGAVNYVDFGEDVFTSFELKGRLYPKEHGLSGFEMGLTAGVTKLEFSSDGCDLPLDCLGSNSTTKKVNSPAVGIEFAYQWLIGRNQHTVIAVGGGGKRFLASRSDLRGTARVIPTMRLGIGYAW